MKIFREISTDVTGITEVKYQMPTKDRAGNLTGGYNSAIEMKTIYDPRIFTDEKMLELGQRASAKGYKNAMMSKSGQSSANIDGVSFRIYIDKVTGMVRNVHPN